MSRLLPWLCNQIRGLVAPPPRLALPSLVVALPVELTADEVLEARADQIAETIRAAIDDAIDRRILLALATGTGLEGASGTADDFGPIQEGAALHGAPEGAALGRPPVPAVASGAVGAAARSAGAIPSKDHIETTEIPCSTPTR